MANPFELDKLTKVSNTNIVYSEVVFKDLALLPKKGQSQFNDFWEERLTKGKTPIDAVIKKNNLCLPGKFEDQQKENEKKLNYSPALLTKLRSALHYRRELTAQLFETELFGVAQCLAETSSKLYHGTKSEIMKKFSALSCELNFDNSSALVAELSPMVRSHNTSNCHTFRDIAFTLHSRISKLASGFKRIDIVADRYFENSLKENMRESRGSGSLFIFSDDTKIPTNFQDDFLKNSANESELYQYLARKFVELHSSEDQVLVATYRSSILTTVTNIETDGIMHCTSGEADQRVVRHVLNLAKFGNFRDILVTTSDTDVFLLLIAYFPLVKEIGEPHIYCKYGVGENAKYYSINTIAENLGFGVCEALPFFHAFSGCDTVSSFFKHSKSVMWNCWMEYPKHKDLTRIFKQLSKQPQEVLPLHVDAIEAFTKYVYYSKMEADAINMKRMKHFEYLAESNLRLLPPSRNGLTEHIKRAVLQGGWLWQEAVHNVEYQNPEDWGWLLKEEKFVPKWQSIEEPIDIMLVCQVCTCKKAICKKCKCTKKGQDCLPFCGCRQECVKSS